MDNNSWMPKELERSTGTTSGWRYGVRKGHRLWKKRCSEEKATKEHPNGQRASLDGVCAQDRAVQTASTAAPSGKGGVSWLQGSAEKDIKHLGRVERLSSILIEAAAGNEAVFKDGPGLPLVHFRIGIDEVRRHGCPHSPYRVTLSGAGCWYRTWAR